MSADKRGMAAFDNPPLLSQERIRTQTGEIA